MWIIRWVTLVVIVIVVLAFALQNQGETVIIRLGGWESSPIPLYLSLFISFAFGMVASLLIGVFQHLQTLSELVSAKKARKRAEEESADLKARLEEAEARLETLREGQSSRGEQDGAEPGETSPLAASGEGGGPVSSDDRI